MTNCLLIKAHSTTYATLNAEESKQKLLLIFLNYGQVSANADAKQKVCEWVTGKKHVVHLKGYWREVDESVAYKEKRSQWPTSLRSIRN